MGAVVYLRILGKGPTYCNILIAKTKVAPLKQVSLPRLELTAASMFANLVRHQIETLELKGIPKFLWSDSTITLSWIQAHPSKWSTYVANRVSSIQTAVPDATWSHVSGEVNPADLASRGVKVHEMLSAEHWFSGTKFLRNSQEKWKVDTEFTPLDKCPEERRVTHVAHQETPMEWELMNRYSSLNKLLKVTARCQQFIRLLKSRIAVTPNDDRSTTGTSGTSAHTQFLTPKEMCCAETFWVRHVQQQHFPNELSAVFKKGPLPSRSKLLRLNSFLDANNVLRLEGRLRHALLEPDEKNPTILPKLSALSRLICYTHADVAWRHTVGVKHRTKKVLDFEWQSDS